MHPLKLALRDTLYWLLDAGETLTGIRDPLTPPRCLMNVGSNSVFRNDFGDIGRELFGYLTGVGGLKSTDRVLDVGCGVGRMAIQLTRYLTVGGSYDGFDIVKPSIEFCQQAISPKFPQFRFVHADVFNSHYNSDGAVQPEDFKFPYTDSSFDFVFLTSVFTHMRHKEIEHYLSEISRVMAPGAKCFSSFFLLTVQTEQAIASGRASIAFEHPVEHGLVFDHLDPDAAIAFQESYVHALHDAAGLRVESIHKGSWSGDNSPTGYQDIVISIKL